MDSKLNFKNIMKQHAKTFYAASIFLPKECAQDAFTLYAFLRHTDDLIDNEHDSTIKQDYLRRINNMIFGMEPKNDLCNEINSLCIRHKIKTNVLKDFLAGMEVDLSIECIENEDELIRYCYYVAGTVGVMMSKILGAHDKRATAFAIDLGIAMQLTNICRDVYEDAQRSRVYIPKTYLKRYAIRYEKLIDLSASEIDVAMAIQELLALAEMYYESARCGIQFLPTKTRFSISLALELYRSIGIRIITKNKCNYKQPRAVVPTWKKFIISYNAATRLLNKSKYSQHHAPLHNPLKPIFEQHDD